VRRAQLFGCPALDIEKGSRGEHPFVCWSSACDGEILVAGYALSEYRLKPWPNEAQSGAWCPHIVGGHIGYSIECAAGCDVPAVVSWDDSPSAHAQRLTHRTTTAFVKSESRPLQDLRVNGDTILLTTHFSGADEGAGTSIAPLRT
jgi:hypothetical protein